MIRSLSLLLALLTVGGVALAAAPEVKPADGALPPEIGKILADPRYPFPKQGYERIEQCDLNSDGIPELVVALHCAEADECDLGVFERQHGKYEYVGAPVCSTSNEWQPVPDKKSSWAAIKCKSDRRAKHLAHFDEAKHSYGPEPEPGPSPDEIRAATDQAMRLFRETRYGDAARAFDKISDSYKFNYYYDAEREYYRALAHYKAGDGTGALKILGNNDYPMAALAYGDIYWAQGDAASAREHYEDYVRHYNNAYDKKGFDTDGLARAKRRVAGQETPQAGKR